MAPPTRNGSAVSTPPDSRPCAVSTLQLTLDLEALPDRVADLVEHLGEIAADVLRGEDSHLEQRQVRIADTLGQAVERLAQGASQADLLGDVPELLGDRVRELLRHDAHGRHQPVAGLERRAHEVERVGELVGEERRAPARHAPHDEQRDGTGEGTGHDRRAAACPWPA